MKPTSRLGVLNPALFSVLAFLAISGNVTSYGNAVAQTLVVPRLRQAALTLRENRTYDFGGRVVRCQPGQQVGIAAESSGNLSVTDVVIEGCEIGIVSSGSAAKVFDTDIRDAAVCMLVAGTKGTISHNTTRQCMYGIVIAGRDNTIADNESSDNSADGILITGDANVVTGNQTLRNGGVGIHVVRMVPMVSENSFVALIQDPATDNMLQRNSAANNSTDLEEFGDCSVGLPNTWADNQFGTKRPDCIR